jgi:hypothetical protein
MTDCDELTLFDRRVIELAPGDILDYCAAFWRDAIVFVVAGEIELECAGGERHRFGRGAILSLAHLSLRDARNSSFDSTQLLAVWRRTAIGEVTG